MQFSPLGLLGNLLQIVAVVLSTTLGYTGKPVMVAVLAGSLVFVIGYVFVRLPQLVGIYQREGAKIIPRLFLNLLLINGALAAALYGTGWVVSRLF